VNLESKTQLQVVVYDEETPLTISSGAYVVVLYLPYVTYPRLIAHHSRNIFMSTDESK